MVIRTHTRTRSYPHRLPAGVPIPLAFTKQAELDLLEPELPPVEQDIFPTLANDDEDFYVNDEEEARIMRREEEEESEEDLEEDGVEEGNNEGFSSENEEDVVPVVPQKRKNGKDPKNPISKIFLMPLLISL